MSEAPSGVPQKRQPLRAHHVFFLLLGLMGLAYLSDPEFWEPWSHFTGGTFHLTPWWSGAGSFAGPDGTYQLYFLLGPLNAGSHPPLYTPLDGDGHLCTPSGQKLNIHVEADMDKHLSSNTLGRSIEIKSFTRSKPGSFEGMKAPGSPYVSLAGVWGPGRIVAKGTLEHEPAAPGHPAPPRAAPITVTLQQVSNWRSPACPTHR